ncbi:hypothetical protein LZ31DRAFT_172837 [Colletotrichum somersetense]|nr:hypothetical protein LZ31DRAFT_172837 [Colletotrichum somersetense]
MYYLEYIPASYGPSTNVYYIHYDNCIVTIRGSGSSPPSSSAASVLIRHSPSWIPCLRHPTARGRAVVGWFTTLPSRCRFSNRTLPGHIKLVEVQIRYSIHSTPGLDGPSLFSVVWRGCSHAAGPPAKIYRKAANDDARGRPSKDSAPECRLIEPSGHGSSSSHLRLST